MIDLKELKRLAEVSIKDCKMFRHTPRRLFNECASPELILQLIKEHQEMREALESILSRGDYNPSFMREVARQTLEGVSK